jgi:hypothetical protein
LRRKPDARSERAAIHNTLLSLGDRKKRTALERAFVYGGPGLVNVPTDSAVATRSGQTSP